MGIQIEIVLIAGVVAAGLIAFVKAIVTGIAISRRQSHHLADKTGASPVPSSIDLRPPE